MANLSRRNQGWGIDPWRDLFDVDFFRNRSRQGGGSLLPAVNISENEQNYMVDVVAPGFKKEDFKVNVENDILTISAEAKQESSEGDNKEFSRREYSYASFTRSFQLPDNAQDDNISARYEDGILKLNIPKSAGEVKASKVVNVQ